MSLRYSRNYEGGFLSTTVLVVSIELLSNANVNEDATVEFVNITSILFKLFIVTNV